MFLGNLNGGSLRLSPPVKGLRQEFDIEGIRPDGGHCLYRHVLGMYRSIRDRIEAQQSFDEDYGSASSTESDKACWGSESTRNELPYLIVQLSPVLW